MKSTKEGYQASLEHKRARVQEELDALSSEIFERDATPTREEWEEMNRLRSRIDGYTELINHFFREPELAPPFRGLLH